MKGDQPKSNRKDKSKSTVNQSNSARRSIPPKPSKRPSKSQEPLIKSFTSPTEPTIKQMEGGQRLLSFVTSKQRQFLTFTFDSLSPKQKAINNSQDTLLKLSNLLQSKAQDNLQQSLNAIQQFQQHTSMRSSNDVEFEQTLSKQQIQQLERGIKNIEPQSIHKHSKTKTSLKIPLQSMEHITVQSDSVTPSSRSADLKKKNASKNKQQKQSSIDLSKGDLEDMKKITLSHETKQALAKLQKYDKEFSKNINQRHLRGILQAECKRQQKIKAINRSMKAVTYDNEITINAMTNILRYHADLNKDIRQRQLLAEENEELHAQIDQLKKLKNEEIKELKLSLKSREGDESSRNRVLDAEIKDFRKTNQMLVPVLKEGNHEKARKLLEPQIKKLANSSNKQIAFERKELLQIILNLLNQPKSETSIESISQSSTNLASTLHGDLVSLFEAENSIERNISHLQKHRRQFEPKIQDTRLFETKELYQTLSQGCNYLISLYHQLREKTNTIVSLNRKIADMERALERTDRLRVQSIEKGDKIIEGLKDGLQRERKQSREFLHRLNSKGSRDEKEKAVQLKLPEILEEWIGVLEGVVEKLQKDDSSWSNELLTLKKKFLNKRQVNEYRSIIVNDITLLDIIARKDKYIEKTEQTNLQLQRKLTSDVKLDFKPSDLERKYSLEKEKAEQLLAQNSSLAKELKQIQRQNDRTKNSQFDEVLQLNKVCYNIDSLLKIPFNKDSWAKIQSKFQNKSQLKSLNSINNTLENLFNRLFHHLNSPSKSMKQIHLNPSVKEFVNQPNKQTVYGEDTSMNELFQLLAQIIENESDIEKYVDLVNKIPFLLNSLAEKISENEESIKKIQQLEFQTFAKGNRIHQLEDLSVSSKTPQRRSEGDSLEPSKEQLYQTINALTRQIQQQNYQNEVKREECYLKIKQAKDECSRLQQEYKERIAILEEEVRKQRELLFYKTKGFLEVEEEVEALKNQKTNLQSTVQQLLERLLNPVNTVKQEKAKAEVKERRVEERNVQTQSEGKEIIEAHIQTDTAIPQQASIRVDILENSQQTSVIQDEAQKGEILQLRSDIAIQQESILQLKQAISDKQSIISRLQSSQASLKTQLRFLESQLDNMRLSQKLAALSSPQKDSLISQLQSQRNQLQVQAKNYYEMSQKYRILFEDCCKQMEDLHHTNQQQMESLTQMHMRNHTLLQDEIGQLKNEKLRLVTKLEEIERSLNGVEKQGKRQQRDLLMNIKRLQNQNSRLANDNKQMMEELGQYQDENIKFKERILILEKEKRAQDESSEDMRKSFSSVLDKRKKRLQGRVSNKSNPQPESGLQLSEKLASLLQSEGKMSGPALRTIVQAINKLILSNRRLIERVKRAQRQNNALYEAINNFTQTQQQVGEGLSVIMHLQQVLADLVQWLDDEEIATEEDLKLGHFFQRLQGCLSKSNYFRYVEIFQQFLQHTIVITFQRSQYQLQMQNRQIDSLREKLMVALNEHLHEIMDEGETEGDEAEVLGQVRILLGVYLKTRNLKVIEDLVTILNVDEVSFG